MVPRVVVVAQAAPAQGGIATFAQTIVSDTALNQDFDMRLLNTTRKAVRVGGAFSLANAWNAVIDAVRVYLAARSADVVHVQTALLPALPLLRAVLLCRAARIGGAAVLCHVHTGLANSGPHESFEPGRLQRLLLRRFRFVFRVLTVSRAGSAGLAPYMPGTTIALIDNAVDVASFERADVAAKPAGLLYVGTLTRGKGLLDLVDAARSLRARGVTGWRMEVVGAGNEAGDQEAEMVRRAFGTEGMEGSLLGPLGGAALRERFRCAGMYVLPSYSEGQPIGILEAMASGLPVVATRVGGIPDVVRDGVDGVLVEPGRPEQLAEALASLIGSSSLRADMGESARRRAEDRFDLARLMARLSELYAEAASSRRKR